MVDIEEIARRELGKLPCGPIPVRSKGPTVFEYTLAETTVRGYYGKYWARTGGQPQTVTSQLDRLLRPAGALPLSLQVVLNTLGDDWRNVFPDSVMRQFKKLIRAGAPLEKIEELIAATAGTGGLRKPDMLGISTQSGVQFDAVEVCTVKTAAETYRELRGKLNGIEHIRHDLVRGLNAVLGPVPPYDDSVVEVRASRFRLAEHEMGCLIPPVLGQEGTARRVSWICYYPSTAWYPGGRGPPGGPDPFGTNGLIIYHIHDCTLPNRFVPAAVREAIEEAIHDWRRENRFDLELNPAVRRALYKERDDWPPEARLLFACLGIGALVLLGSFIAVEVAIAMGAGELLAAGAVAVAEAPMALTGALRTSDLLAAELWRAGSYYAELLPLSP